MKALGVLALVLILSLLSSVRGGEVDRPRCPILSDGETSLDCPWAMIAREIGDETNPAKISRKLLELAPDYMARIATEGKLSHAVKSLWGQSINFDANAKATIIPEPIIDAILAQASVYRRDGVLVHAGFEHTYGYLLSNLKTPYGFKRLRWVRPDIEIGFGLEPGSLSPAPRTGGLLMNISTFAGHVAFRGRNVQDREALKILRRTPGASRSIRFFDYRKISGRRLTETVTFRNGRRIELRTDFVPFFDDSGTRTGGNTELLIYSVRDSARRLPYLISAFPVGKGFSDSVLDPENLGSEKPITTRYNGFVPGMTGARVTITGNREASEY